MSTLEGTDCWEVKSVVDLPQQARVVFCKTGFLRLQCFSASFGDQVPLLASWPNPGTGCVPAVKNISAI